jgi:hypothetical protein
MFLQSSYNIYKRERMREITLLICGFPYFRLVSYLRHHEEQWDSFDVVFCRGEVIQAVH